MKQLLDKLHARLGDFWWYSLMIFMAARAADCLNVFVGLWLVPKYVPPSELGAVQPLANFASFLALPAAVFASTFRQELSNLAVNRQFGKMKTLMRSVFIAAAIFLFLAIVISHFVLPHFLHRIRIAEGSLGMLIIVYSFINTLSPIFSNALQSLKKFKATTVISLLGAPIRFLAMLATMPLRALSGYFIGQTSTPAFSIVTSVIALRRELSVKAEPYWNRAIISQYAKLAFIFSVSALATYAPSLVESTIIRQRLPELDSAAYYMTTRLSEIASFLYTALAFTIFPFAAEIAAKGKSTIPLFLKASGAIVLTNGLLAILFWLGGRAILSVVPNGELYADYSWAIPWLIGNATVLAITGLYTNAEVSANRFGYLILTVPTSLAYAASMLFVTGYGYFTAFLPASWTDFLTQHNIRSLGTMILWISGGASVRLLCCIIHAIIRKGLSK